MPRFSEYTTRSIEEVFGLLGTSEKGLSARKTAELLKKFGQNEVKIKEEGLIDIFLRQFKSPFSYLLFAASLIAFLIGEKIDGAVILAFVFINVILGFFQEAKAKRAVSLLKKYLPSKIRILRGGKEKAVDRKSLVPGDIVLLEQGDIVPADLRVWKAENFSVDEEVLSGESISVPKNSNFLPEKAEELFKASNIVFSGTSVVSGEAVGVVVATGKETALGEITKLTSTIARESLYEKNLLSFSHLILRIVVITIVIIFLANLAVKGTAGLFDFLLFCIALTVSIIPEALPLIITFALSSGALKLAKKKVVVKRLSAVEDLGDIEILCSDKTGTLTKNKLKLENSYSSDKNKCLLYGLLSSAYIEEEIESSLNPFDMALFEVAPKKIRKSLEKFKLVAEKSFDLLRLRNSVLMEDSRGERVLISRGAPESILSLCSKFEGSREKIEAEMEKKGKEGKRILALAFKHFNRDNFYEEDEEGMNFLGYFSFFDPLKETAKEAIALAGKLGVQVKILTGDSKEVAGQVAKEIGLIENQEEVILGETIDSYSSEDFERACENFSVFARVSPNTKYRIVKSLGEKHEVGFLGEGVNDAPALKASHLAIAVQSAADVSREIADIVLLRKDLKVIVEGIKQGRNIFSNINKYIKCTLASNFGNFYSIAIISLIIPFLPMLPVQILLVNMLSDFPLVAVASDRVDVEELKKPKFYQLNKVILLIVLLGLTSTIFDFIFFAIFHNVAPSLLRTLWFTESILTEIALIFSVRTFHIFFKARSPSFSLAAVSVLTLLITVGLPFTALGQETFHLVAPALPELLIVLSLIVIYFTVSEAVKLIYFRYWTLKNGS